MSDTFIERSICEAISIIADQKIAQASFDKTIKAIIKEVANKATGQYKVKYEDSIFSAYATSSEIFYDADQEVNVLIPGNDWTRKKIIVSGINVNATNYQQITPAEESYNTNGINLIQEEEKFGLSSYKPGGDVVLLYAGGSDKRSTLGTENDDIIVTENDDTIIVWDNLIALNLEAINKYIKNSTGIALGFTVQTALDNYQKAGGYYGMIVEAEIQDAQGHAATQRYNVSNIDGIGNPFNYIRPTKIENFEKNADTAHFKKITRIELYAYGFPRSKENYSPDIFFSDLFIIGGNALTEDELNGYVLHIDYSAKGNELNNEIKKVPLQAQLKVKGRIITQNVSYYWFRKNGLIFKNSSKYSSRGGEGWQCLNAFTEFSAVPYSDNTFFFVADEADNPDERTGLASERSTQILCVAYYNGESFKSNINIINYNVGQVKIISSDRKIISETNSENKTVYYFGSGNPIFTCDAYDKDGNLLIGDDYNYTWTVTSERGKQVIKKEQDPSFNDKYNSLKEKSEEYYEAAERIEKSKVKDYLEEVKSTLESWSELQYTQHIEKNVYYYFPVNTVINYATISCAVTKGQTYIGTGFITIQNRYEVEGMYSLNIDNGTHVFQYDGKGNSPCSPQLQKPLELEPLTFTLLDNTGTEISYDAVINSGNVYWLFPKGESLLISNVDQEFKVPNEFLTSAVKAFSAQFDVYKNIPSFSYSIANQYDLRKINNNIRLYVEYKDLVFDVYTNFTFPKDGDPGTNGTDFIAKIVPVGINNTALSTERIYISNQKRDQIFDDSGNKVSKLSFQLYNNSIKVFNTGTTDSQRQIKPDYWTCPPSVDGVQKKFQTQKPIPTYLELKPNNTSWENFQLKDIKKNNVNNITADAPVNIIRAQYGVGGQQNALKYYAQYPVCTQFVVNNNFRIKVKPKTGFQYVVYEEDGTNPKYDNLQPFTIIIETLIQSQQNKQNKYWQINNNYLTKNWTWYTIGNLELDNNKNIDLPNNKRYFKPKDNFSGQDLSSAILVNIQDVGRIHIPVYMIINRYGHSAINGWDGNSIDLGNDPGTILAPQVGAGSKDKNNRFTGVLMGQIKTSNETQVGFLGYHQGQRSIFLDSETGNATFGKQGAAQIKIVASSGEGTIQSGDYNSEYKKTTDKNINIQKTYYTLNDNGNYIKVTNPKIADITTYYQLTGAGMKIKFSSTGSGNEKGPYIKYGSNNFYVNSDGHIHAAGGGDIAGWSIDSNKISKGNTGMSSQITTVKDIDPSGNRPWQDSTVAFYAGQTLQDRDKDENNEGPKSPNFYVTHSGYLFSKHGQIGGWTISENSFWNSYKPNTGPTVYIGMNADPDSQDSKEVVTGHKAKAFFANGENFYVTHDGYLRSTSGQIAAWDIGPMEFTNGTVGLGERSITLTQMRNSFTGKTFTEGVTANFWAQDTSTNIKDYNFILDQSGNLYSKAGLIGGWNIEKDQLWAVNSDPDTNNPKGTRIGADGTISGGYGTAVINNNNITGGSWQINADGTATFNNITAVAGKIGNWYIDNGAIRNSDSTVSLSSDGSLEAKKGHIGTVVIDGSGIRSEDSSWYITNSSAHFTGLDISFVSDTKGVLDAGGGGGGSLRAVDGSGTFQATGVSINGNTTTIGSNNVTDSHLDVKSITVDGASAEWTQFTCVADVTADGPGDSSNMKNDLVQVTDGTKITYVKNVEVQSISITIPSVAVTNNNTASTTATSGTIRLKITTGEFTPQTVSVANQNVITKIPSYSQTKAIMHALLMDGDVVEGEGQSIIPGEGESKNKK